MAWGNADVSTRQQWGIALVVANVVVFQMTSEQQGGTHSVSAIRFDISGSDLRWHSSLTGALSRSGGFMVMKVK